MEELLDIYAQPYNPKCPVICMDEQPVPLQREVCTPIAATAKQPKRVDYEYERAGTASILMFTDRWQVGGRSAFMRDERKWIGQLK